MRITSQSYKHGGWKGKLTGAHERTWRVLMVRGSRQMRTNRMTRNRWEANLQMSSEANNQNGGILDQNDVYSLAKEKPGIVFERKFL